MALSKRNEIMEKVGSPNYKWIHIQFLDINGQLREIQLSSRLFSDIYFDIGIQSEEVGELFGSGDLRLRPIPESYTDVPWEDGSIRLLSEILKGGKEFNKDPHLPMKKALEKLKETLNGEIFLKHDLMFFIFDNIGVDRVMPEKGPTVSFDTREGRWASQNPYIDNQSLSTLPYDTNSLLRQQLALVFSEFLNFSLEKHFHGRGVGQQTITFSPMKMPEFAYNLVLEKYVIKNTILLNGARATFMPYPLPNVKASRIKMGVDIKRRNQSIFYTKDSALTDEALYFIGGILEHARALSIFTLASVNSYTSLHTNPLFVAVTENNDEGVVSVENKNIKLNLMDGTANPYLALAAVISAGIDGIKKKSMPMEVVEDRPSSMSPRERKSLGIEKMPENIPEALEALHSDNSFLKGIFPAEVTTLYLEEKVKEHEEAKKYPRHYEYVKYLDV